MIGIVSFGAKGYCTDSTFPGDYTQHSSILRVNNLAEDFCTNSGFYSTKKGQKFGTLKVSRG